MLPVSHMAPSLQELWKCGREGTLCPFEALKAWSLTEAYLEAGFPEKRVDEQVAKKVTKVGGGHPTGAAAYKLLSKIDAADDWHPGKVYGDVGGRPAALSTVAQFNPMRVAASIGVGARSGDRVRLDPTRIRAGFAHICALS